MNLKLFSYFFFFNALFFLVFGNSFYLDKSKEVICPLEEARFYATIQNSFNFFQSFSINLDGLPSFFTYFVVPSVEVAPNSSKEIILSITPSTQAIPGKYFFELVAESPFKEQKTSGLIEVRDCSNLIIEVPQEISLCSCESKAFPVVVKNNGHSLEEGVLSTNLNPSFYSSSISSFSLKPGESKSFLLNIAVPCGTESQANPLIVYAGRSKSESLLKILPCGLPYLSLPAQASVYIGESTVLNAFLSNRGALREDFVVSSNCTSFLFIEKNEFSLEPNESVSFSMIVSPPLGKENTFYCKIFAYSNRFKKEFVKNLLINVIQKEKKVLNNVLVISPGFFELEKDIESRIRFSVKNIGNETLSSLTFFFPKQVEVISQIPFNLKPGESKNVEIKAKGLEEGSFFENALVYSQQGVSFIPITFLVSKQSLSIELRNAEVIEVSNDFVKINQSILVNNFGKKVYFYARVLEFNSMFDPAYSLVGEKESALISFSAWVKKGASEKYTLLLETDRGTYSFPIELKGHYSKPFTGLFFLGFSSGILFLSFLFFVLLIILVYYLVELESSLEENYYQKIIERFHQNISLQNQ